MNQDKKAISAQLAQKLESSPYMLLVDYTGLTMPQFNTIRKRLREVNASFHVSKNSYIKAVGTDKNYPAEIQKDLVGQTAIVYGEKDVCAAANVISLAKKEFQKPVLKSGVLDGTFLSSIEVQELADVGSRDNLLAKLLGVLNAPAGAIARAIAAKIAKDGSPAEPTPESTPAPAEPETAAAPPAAE